ncbi:hypothetical protein [Ekhidna sp.]|jgi:hypothetical protein|uniref:hypothetical protein n=1 Tax=Ekhidna sp. TaxID=2608089 RepID=UPI0032EEB19E
METFKQTLKSTYGQSWQKEILASAYSIENELMNKGALSPEVVDHLNKIKYVVDYICE